MTLTEKAKIILEALDEYHNVDWNFEEFYLKGIKNGLLKIDEMEKKEYKSSDGFDIIK